MGLITMLVDVVALSAGAAAVRRGTGYSAKEWVCSRLSSTPLRGLAASYFNIGEAVVFSVVKYAEVLRAGRETRLRDSEGREADHHRDGGQRPREFEREREWGRPPPPPPHDREGPPPPQMREPPRPDERERQFRKD